MSMTRITLALATTLSGWFVGRFTAFLVWMFIYGIGSRVVSDEIHYRLHDSVVIWGGVVGALFALTVSLQVRRTLPLILCQFAGHIFATIAGFLGGGFDWKMGLVAYFSTPLLVVLGVWFRVPAMRFLSRLFGPEIAA